MLRNDTDGNDVCLFYIRNHADTVLLSYNDQPSIGIRPLEIVEKRIDANSYSWPYMGRYLSLF